MENLQQRRPIRPTTLMFYLRSKDEKEVKAGKFTMVKIQIMDKDLRKTIQSILTTCNLPTEFLDKIEKKGDSNTEAQREWRKSRRDGEFDFRDLEDDLFYASMIMKRKINTEPDTFKYETCLTSFFQSNKHVNFCKFDF